MKKLAELRKKSKQLFNFWRSYLLVMVLFLGCILLLCAKTFSLLEENVKTNTYKNVEQGMEILDNEIITLNNVVIDVQSFKYYTYIRGMDSEREARDFYAFKEMQQKITDSTKFLSFAQDCMLYFPNGILFLDDIVYAIEAQDSYGRLHTEKYGKLEDWFDEIDEGRYIHTFLEADRFYDSIAGTFEGIPYVHSYTRANSAENPLFVTIFPIQSLLEVWRLEELNHIAGITVSNNNNGEILYTNDTQVTGWSSEFEVTSKNSALSVRVCIPNSYFMDQLTEIIALVAVYIAGVLVVAIIVSVGLAYRNSMPIRRIISALNRYTEGPKEDNSAPYEYIEQSITEIGDSAIHHKVQHTALNQEISHWMLREQILNGLDGKQLEEFRERYADFSEKFRLVILQLTQTEWNILAAEAKELLLAHKITFCFFSKVRPNLFVMLCNDCEDITAFRQSLHLFLDQADEKWMCDCLISVSLSHDSLEDLKEIYHRVWCNMKCFSERKLIFQEDIEEYEKNNLQDFNILENIRLTDMILSGNEKDAVNLIRIQWEKARAVRVDAMFEQLFYMQFTVLTSVALRLDYDISATELSYQDSISEIETKMVEIAVKLCGYVQSKKEDNKNDVPKRIIEYMKEHYSDPEFYMTTLVEEFGLSDKTIAKLIKGYQNMTFSEYLEELRLQKAITLLEDTQLSIGNVANASGFSSENTFFKVFKRKFGTSPSGYRSNKQIMKDRSR